MVGVCTVCPKYLALQTPSNNNDRWFFLTSTT